MAKKKKSKKPKEVGQIDFILSFSEVTLLETDGVFSEVKDKMEKQEDFLEHRKGYTVVNLNANVVGEHDWCLKTRLSIASDFGECRFNLDFHHDGRVIILGYLPSPAGMFTTDVGCLSRWCQENGWKVPEPSQSLILSKLDLWKQLWNTLLVDSEYLDDRFGVRAALDVRSIPEDPEDEFD